MIIFYDDELVYTQYKLSPIILGVLAIKSYKLTLTFINAQQLIIKINYY
jgi:hypothetical protein